MSGGTKRKRTETSTRAASKASAESDGDDHKCAFHEEIDLASVRADVAAHLKRNDVLDVAMHREGEYETAVCRTRSPRKIVGTLANVVGLDRLIACMRTGHQYEARIVLIRSTHCRVLVDRVPK
jgi:hypothetical protein